MLTRYERVSGKTVHCVSVHGEPLNIKMLGFNDLGSNILTADQVRSCLWEIIASPGLHGSIQPALQVQYVFCCCTHAEPKHQDAGLPRRGVQHTDCRPGTDVSVGSVSVAVF